MNKKPSYTEIKLRMSTYQEVMRVTGYVFSSTDLVKEKFYHKAFSTGFESIYSHVHAQLQTYDNFGTHALYWREKSVACYLGYRTSDVEKELIVYRSRLFIDNVLEASISGHIKHTFNGLYLCNLLEEQFEEIYDERCIH